MSKKKPVTLHVAKKLEDIEVELDEAIADLDDTCNRIDDMLHEMDAPQDPPPSQPMQHDNDSSANAETDRAEQSDTES